ncbi:hypothetical protein BVG81_005540 [Haliangium sp. UPWRP_2]|nr:hypothetical protein BVG81_005540 [Haliangium sp. UPWRP_2]
MYRERKQQQHDTSQKDGGEAVGTKPAISGSAGRRQRSSPSTRPAKWAELVSAATERIIETIQKHGLLTMVHTMDAMRVDMRDQLISQAPKTAVGYRLVLQAHHGGGAPKFSPRRSRTREVAWYTLTPFEYPDDIRLCDGRWYRIVWLDARGQRIPLQPGEPVPGLCYFVGPIQLGGQTPIGSPAAACELQRQVAQDTPPRPAGTDQPEASPEQATLSPVAEIGAAPGATSTNAPSAHSAPSSGADVESLAREFARMSKLAREQADRPGSSGETALDHSALVLMVPPTPTTAPPESWTRLLASFPPLTVDENLMLIDFVAHPDLILQIRYEEQLAEARASGRPLPREPITLISNETRQNLHELFTMHMLPSHFWSRCRAIFDYVRQHGVEVLAHLPVPLPPLPAPEQRFIDTAVTSAPKRAYMNYVCDRQDALLSGEPLPVEPSVPLSSKERNQLRKTLEDLRAVMYFKGRAASFGS